MATSDVEICKRALHLCGAGNITSLNDASERARVMKLSYDPVRKAEIRRHMWRFALSRAGLVALADAPASGYARQFQVPNDFLRLVPGGHLIGVPDLSDLRSGESANYSLERGKILTNVAAPLQIRYLADVEDPNEFDAAFCEALAARLAYENCERITESTQKRVDCLQGYKLAIREAKVANSMEVAASSQDDDTWIAARFQ